MNIAEQALYNIREKRLMVLSENQKRREQIQKLPDYIILQEKFQAAIKKIIFSNSDNKEERLNKIKEHMNKMESELLIKHGFPSDYLQIKYFCSECKDSGENCTCIQREYKRLLVQEMSKSSLSSQCSFENIDLTFYKEFREQMSCIFRCCRKYAQDFTLSSSSLFMFGDTGLGKTHFSLAIGNELINKGYTVAYHSALKIFRYLEDEYFNFRSTELLDMLTTVDMLIIDDLGVEMDNKFYKTRLYEIVENRINNHLPLIINTNLGLTEIKNKYDKRIASRLTTFVPLQFLGEDIRLQKNKFYERIG